jgi:hypothetical protein
MTVAPLGGEGIVRDHHDGLLEFLVELLEQAQYLVGVLAIEVAGGLVGDDDGGSLTMARAMATRCSCPPESWRG